MVSDQIKGTFPKCVECKRMGYVLKNCKRQKASTNLAQTGERTDGKSIGIADGVSATTVGEVCRGVRQQWDEQAGFLRRARGM